MHLHKELAEKVKIVIFNPGPTQTPLFTKFWKEIKKRYSNESSISSSSDDVAKTLINSLKKMKQIPIPIKKYGITVH